MAGASLFDRAVDAINRPLEMICGWFEEPLKKWEHRREEESRESKHKRKKEMERQRAELEIKRRVEIEQAMIELEDWRKECDFRRTKEVTEAIITYQKELIELSESAIRAIGDMQLDLREKAANLLHAKQYQYKQLQNEAIRDAHEDLKKIEEDFPEDGRPREILERAVEYRLMSMLETATCCSKGLNKDIQDFRDSISRLAEHNQEFVTGYLSRFELIGLEPTTKAADGDAHAELPELTRRELDEAP